MTRRDEKLSSLVLLFYNIHNILSRNITIHRARARGATHKYELIMLDYLR